MSVACRCVGGRLFIYLIYSRLRSSLGYTNVRYDFGVMRSIERLQRRCRGLTIDQSKREKCGKTLRDRSRNALMLTADYRRKLFCDKGDQIVREIASPIHKLHVLWNFLASFGRMDCRLSVMPPHARNRLCGGWYIGRRKWEERRLHNRSLSGLWNVVTAFEDVCRRSLKTRLVNNFNWGECEF